MCYCEFSLFFIYFYYTQTQILHTYDTATHMCFYVGDTEWKKGYGAKYTSNETGIYGIKINVPKIDNEAEKSCSTLIMCSKLKVEKLKFENEKKHETQQ